jgi:hypothetical protein
MSLHFPPETNPAHALDGVIPVLFASGRLCPRAAQAGRYAAT